MILLIKIFDESLRVSSGNSYGELLEPFPLDVDADEALNLAVGAVEDGRRKWRQVIGGEHRGRRGDVTEEEMNVRSGVGYFENAKSAFAFGAEINEGQLRVIGVMKARHAVVHLNFTGKSQ